MVEVLKIGDWLSSKESQFAIISRNFVALRFKDDEIFKIGEVVQRGIFPYSINKFCEDNIHVILLFYDNSELKVEIDEISSIKHLLKKNG